MQVERCGSDAGEDNSLRRSVDRVRWPELVEKCSFELGDWTVSQIEGTMEQVWRRATTLPQMAAQWVEVLSGTPFRYETLLPQIGDRMRVRLKTFDCITFAYHVIALAGARDFGEYLRRLYLIRYVNWPECAVSNDPATGNFMDFACEALMINAVQCGFLVDVTKTAATKFTRIQMRLAPTKRPLAHDPEETVVYPRYPNFYIDTLVADAKAHDGALLDVRDGDLIVLTRGVRDGNGNAHSLFVHHVGFCKRIEGVISMIHATKNYYVTRSAVALERFAPIEGTYLPGVVGLGEYLGDDRIYSDGGAVYHGYDMDRPRPLLDYARNFSGFKVFRLA